MLVIILTDWNAEKVNNYKFYIGKYVLNDGSHYEGDFSNDSINGSVYIIIYIREFLNGLIKKHITENGRIILYTVLEF